MLLFHPSARRLVLIAFLSLPGIAGALTLDNEKATYATLASTTVTLTGRSELHFTGSGDPIPGCIIQLNSEDSWVFFEGVAPSGTVSTLLSRIQVNGAAAVLDSNVRVVEYIAGSVVIPQPANFQPLEVFTGTDLTGASTKLNPYTAYGTASLGLFADRIRSFKLKRGYTATFAQNENGTGISQNYVAQDSDMEVSVLPSTLDGTISFIRVFPWRWTGKKGTCDIDPVALNASWNYNWNISQNSTLDREYVAIKQQRYWPGLDQNWKSRGVNHLLGYNEPNNPVEDAYTSLDNGSTTTAVAAWPDLLSTGLRVGSPAVTDGGYSWIVDFMNKANAAGMRVDYVPVHYYRSYPNNANAAGAATNLYNFLKGIHDATQRPIWLTEFNNGANWTTDADPTFAENKNVVEAMINMMDTTPWIERYSVYSAVEEVRQVYYNAGGLTPMGVMYRDHVAPIAHQQVAPDSGKSAAADYLFEGTTRDGSGNGNNPLTYGTPKLVAGKQGQGLSFDGTDDYLALPARIGDSDDFTFTAWVKWNGGNIWQRIFDLGNGTASNLFLTAKSGSNTLRFAIKLNNSAEQLLNAPLLPVGVWSHVAVTLSGDTGKLFVNGVLADTQTITINPSAIGTTTNYLGKSQWPDPLFSGSLDSVRFLTTALSDAQIAAAASTATLQFNSDPFALTGALPMQPFTASITGYANSGNGGRVFTKIAGPAWLAIAADGTLTGVPTQADTGNNSFLVRVTDSSGLIDNATLNVLVAEAPGIVTRYSFNGNTSADAGKFNGIATGGPVYTTGHHSTAIVLDGTDDFVTLPGGVANHDEITLATWVRWNGGSPWQRIFDFGNGTGEGLFLTPSSGSTLRFSISADGATAQELNAPLLPVNTWTHVAVTLGSGTGKLYINGVLVDTKAVSVKPSDIMPAMNYLGKSQWPDPLFAGRLDEFVIFNRALADSEIASLFSGAPPAFASDPIVKPGTSVGTAYVNSISASGSGLTYSKVGGPKWLTVEADGRISGVPMLADAGTNRFTVRATSPSGYADDATMNISVLAPAELLAHYQFQNSTADSAGSNHGTATGGPIYVGAVFDQAIDLDGTDDFVTLPPAVVGGLNDFTIATRIRWDGGNDWQRIFDFGNGTGSFLFLTPGSGGKTLRFAITTGSGEQRLNAPMPPLGEWTHVAITLVGTTGTLYVNGAPVDTQTITLKPSNVAPVTNYLGKSQFAADPYFNGAIDDFRIFNRALTTAEVRTLAVPPSATIVPRPSYALWASGFSFPEGQGLPESDPDGDGYANLLEWIFGTDPVNSPGNAMLTANLFTAAQLGLADNKNYLGLTARLRKVRPGTTVIPEGAASPTDLGTPESATQVILSALPVDDGDFEIFTWYYSVAIEDAPSAFMRLRVLHE